MLDLTSVFNSTLIDHPFRYSVINQLFHTNEISNILASLPKENYFRSTRSNGSDKTYNVVNNILLKLGDNSYSLEAHLSPTWVKLITQLAGQEYRGALSELLKVDLLNCYQEITIKRYGYGDFISAHTDTDKVRATHMIFLNSSWNKDWGGQLCFMEDEKTIFKRFMPSIISSVAFVRAANSWHSVEKIIQKGCERIALQVAFWNTTERNPLPGRIEEKTEVY